jgi:tol-pal system protein YbgF
MIRRLAVPRACPMLLLAMITLVAAPAAMAQQDATTQERLDRLERDLSMLQRQVYHGGDGEALPGSSAGTGDSAVDLQVRMDRLEQQMRDLTGRVEDETNQVEQLRQRIEQINSDMQVGEGQGQGQGQPTSGSPHSADAPAMAAGEPQSMTDPAATAPYGGPQPPAQYPPDQSADYGTLTPPGVSAEQPGNNGAYRPYPGPTQLTPQTASNASGGGLRPSGGETMPSGSASAQYNAAFGLLRRADYPAAEEALRSFVQHHPDNPLAGNAQYWLGESFYARGRYADAAAAFADGYKRYPRGAKAADGLLQLGMSLARDDQKHNACIALMQLDHQFPHAGSAIKIRASQEKKRLGC